MNIKLLILLFSVFAISQAAYNEHANLKGDVLVDDLANLLEWVARAVTAINLELKKIDFSDEGLIKYTQAAALSANKRILNLLDYLRKETTDTGKVIIDCFEAQQTTVEADLNETATEIGQCAKLGMSGVKWYMDEYIEGMDWINDNLNKYAADLRNCDDKLAITCIIQVIEKNELYLTTLIAYAGGRIMEIAIGVVGGIVVANEIKNCADSVVDKHLEAYSKQVFSAAVTCIEKKNFLR